MRIATWIGAGVLAGVAALGCGSTGSEALLAPTGLRVEATTDFDRIELYWNAPAGTFDGFELEGRMGDGAWEQLHEGLVPPDVIGVELFLDPATPEATTISFRIRAVRGDARSPYSPEASYRRGVRAPDLSVSSGWGVGVHLSWVNRSAVADALRLERTARVDGVALGPAEVVPVAFPAISYDDTAAWTDCVELSYRLVYSKGQDVSAPSSGITMAALPLAPTSLSVIVASDIAAVSWTNVSVHAARVEVLRGNAVHWGYNWTEPGAIVALPPGSTSYVDAGLPRGAYSYAVRSSCTGGQVATSPAVGAIAGTWDPFAASALTMPSGGSVARDAVGRWFILRSWLGGAGESGFHFSVPEGAGWETHVRIANPGYSASKPLLDAQGRPHAVYVTVPTAPAAEMFHDWREADGWHTETVAHPSAGSWDAPAAAFDADGVLHVVWAEGVDTLRHASNAGGSWSVEEVAVATVTTHGWLIQARAGGSRLAVVLSSVYGDPIVLLVRDAGGVWTEETVPTGPVTANVKGDCLPRAFVGSGAEEVLFSGFGSDPVAGGWWTVRRDAGVWRPPELVPPPYGQAGCPPTAATRDLGRFAFVADSWEAHVAVREAGAWTVHPLFPTWFGLHAEFSDSGKVVVLDGLANDQAELVNYLLYEER